MSKKELRKFIATPIRAEKHFTLPEPQNLATLFPGDTIETYTMGDLSISFPSSFRVSALWEDIGDEKKVRSLILYDNTPNCLTLCYYNNPKEPAFSEDYEAYVTKKLVDGLTRDNLEVMRILRISHGEYYLQYYSAKATEFRGRPAVETLINFVDFGSNATQNFIRGSDYWPHGVTFRIRLPVEKHGYYSFTISIPDEDDHRAITRCDAFSSVLNTLAWKK